MIPVLKSLVPTEVEVVGVDEALLVKSEGVIENDDERTTWVEYRFIGSDAVAHRSVHVTLKKWPEGMGAAAGIFG